jgi:hypothetical protein
MSTVYETFAEMFFFSTEKLNGQKSTAKQFPDPYNSTIYEKYFKDRIWAKELLDYPAVNN